MKYMVMRRRPGTPQERWRPIPSDPFDTPELADQWIAENPMRDGWEYHVLPVPA